DVVRRQSDEAEPAPQEEPGAAGAVAADQQDGAGDRRERAERVDQGDHQSSRRPRRRKASEKLCIGSGGFEKMNLMTATRSARYACARSSTCRAISSLRGA